MAHNKNISTFNKSKLVGWPRLYVVKRETQNESSQGPRLTLYPFFYRFPKTKKVTKLERKEKNCFLCLFCWTGGGWVFGINVHVQLL